MQLWNGLLRQRCASADGAVPDAFADQICAIDADGFTCPPPLTCQAVGGNPGFGIDGFDNFGQSLLVIYRVVTLTNWTFVLTNARGVQESL